MDGRDAGEWPGRARGIRPPARVNAFGDPGPQVALRRARRLPSSPRLRDDALEVVQHGRALRAPAQVRLDSALLVGGEFAVEIIREPVRPFFVHRHDPPRCLRISMRARCSCRFDVPVAISSMTAISRCL